MLWKIINKRDDGNFLQRRFILGPGRQPAMGQVTFVQFRMELTQHWLVLWKTGPASSAHTTDYSLKASVYRYPWSLMGLSSNYFTLSSACPSKARLSFFTDLLLSALGSDPTRRRNRADVWRGETAQAQAHHPGPCSLCFLAAQVLAALAVPDFGVCNFSLVRWPKTPLPS